MALVPLIKTSRVTVRAAIDHQGLGSKTSAGDRLVARLSRSRRFDRGVLMALRNTVRRPGPVLLPIGLLASAGMVFVSGMSLSSGAQAINEEQARRPPGTSTSHSPPPPTSTKSSHGRSDTRGHPRRSVENRAPTGVAGPGKIPITRTYPDQGHGRVSSPLYPPTPSPSPARSCSRAAGSNPGETGALVLNQITRANTAPDVARR